MPNSQINPLLIKHLRFNEEKEIPDTPTPSWLTGKYAREVLKNIDKVEPIYEENWYMLTCNSCGRKGKYNVGLIAFNIDKKAETKGPNKSIQTIGYFRCKHCNAAGNWEMPSQIYGAMLFGVLDRNNRKVHYGENIMYDGSMHPFASDAEEHLLRKLQGDEDEAFIWNRIGNLYQKGNRPELAVCAFEKSLTINPNQTESHYTLGVILSDIDDFENATFHYKQMLLTASDYTQMKAEQLRDILAAGLQELFFNSQLSDGEFPFLPTKDELEAAGKLEQMEKTQKRFDLEFDLYPEDHKSFYPLAEMYMGQNQKKIPKHMRVLDNLLIPTKTKKKKKKRRWDRGTGTLSLEHMFLGR